MPRLTKADISGPSNFQHVGGVDRSGKTFGLDTYNEQEPVIKGIYLLLTLIL